MHDRRSDEIGASALDIHAHPSHSCVHPRFSCDPMPSDTHAQALRDVSNTVDTTSSVATPVVKVRDAPSEILGSHATAPEYVLCTASCAATHADWHARAVCCRLHQLPGLFSTPSSGFTQVRVRFGNNVLEVAADDSSSNLQPTLPPRDVSNIPRITILLPGTKVSDAMCTPELVALRKQC